MSGGPEANALRLCFFTASILCTFCPSCAHLRPILFLPPDNNASSRQPIRLAPVFRPFLFLRLLILIEYRSSFYTPSTISFFASAVWLPLAPPVNSQAHLLSILPATFICSSPCTRTRTTSCLLLCVNFLLANSIASFHPIQSPFVPLLPFILLLYRPSSMHTKPHILVWLFLHLFCLAYIVIVHRTFFSFLVIFSSLISHPFLSNKHSSFQLSVPLPPPPRPSLTHLVLTVS